MASDDRQDLLLNLLSDAVAKHEGADTVSDVLADARRILNETVNASSVLGMQGESGAVQGSGRVIGQAALEPDAESGIDHLTRQLLDLTRATLSQTDTVDANTQAVIENSIAAASGSGSSTGASIGKTALKFLGGGFGLASLVGKLFGGSDGETAPSLLEYTLPSSVNLDAGLSHQSLPGLHPIRYASDGLPRTLESAATSPSTPITIQVQAMDSRSFLDHSSEIANAVREALLNSHSLNDVVVEL